MPNGAKHAVIMTFPAEKIDDYGFCISGFIKNWPKSIQGFAYIENAHLVKHMETSNLKIIDLDHTLRARLADFESRNSDRNISDMSTVGDISFQAAKFSRKAFVQQHGLENIDCDFLHYIDGDLFTHRLSIQDITSYLEGDHLIYCVPRWWQKDFDPMDSITDNKLHIGYTETGYIVWNKNHPDLHFWTECYRRVYDADLIFNFEAWHDCIAFDYATIMTIQERGSSIKDLSFESKSENPLVTGPLGKYFDHMKGNRKFSGSSEERLLAHGTIIEKMTIIFKNIIRRFKHL